MNNIKNNGNYFVKDSEVLSSKNDEFRHIDIANNIINLVENGEAPFNIAIVGRWGIGKSSITKMIKHHFDKKQEEFVVEEINAWKYEKEALRRVFLKRILEKLGYKDKNYIEKLAEKLKSHTGIVDESNMKFSEYIKEWFPLLGMALILYIGGVLLSLFGQAILSNANNVDFNGKVWIDFVLTGFAQNFYIPIFIILIQQYIRGSSKKLNLKLTAPITSTDEYEEQLQVMMSKSKKKKVITVIDDLDRLTPDKIVEALDAIKAFVNYEKCVFIVPFDDTVLKKALANKTISLSKNEHLFIESELFLDKLFQYKIYLPNVISSDLPQYAVDLVKSEAFGLYELINEEQYNHLIKEVLIHKGVTTPRQVKKIINTFSHYILLATRRESDRVPKDTFLSSQNIKALAKLSVIQADFSDFYYKMFEHPTLIDDFMNVVKKINSDKNSQIDIPEVFEPYFITTSDDDSSEQNVIVSKSADNLYMFLNRTSAIVCDNYTPFLYMDYDSVSVIFGSELSRELRNALTSGASEIVKNRLDNNKSKDLSDLFYDILSYAEPFEYAKCCEILINIYPDYNLNKNTKLIELIAQRVFAIYKSGFEFEVNKINFECLCAFNNLITNKAGITQAIFTALSIEDSDKSNRLKYFFLYNENFDKNSQDLVIKYIDSELGDKGKLTVGEFCKIETLDVNKHFTKYLNSLSLLSKIASEITKNASYKNTDNDVALLSKLLEKHIEKKNFNAAIKSLLPNLTDEDLFVIIADYIINAKEEIDINIGTEIFAMVITYNDSNNKKKANSLLPKIEWKIKPETKEQSDEYLMSVFSDENIDSILQNIAKNKQIVYIPQTVDEINRSFIENSIGYNTLEAIQVYYTVEQKTNIITYIKDKASYAQNANGKDFEMIGKVIESLAKDKTNHELLNSLFISRLYADIVQQVNQTTYSSAASSILPSILSFINDAHKQQFITWSITATNINRYPILSIKILDAFSEYLTIQHNGALNVVMNLTEPSLSSAILNLLKLIRKNFENGTDVLTSYRDYLVSKLQEADVRNEVIDDIGWFGSIGNIGEFMQEGIKYTDIKESFIQTSLKFLRENKNSDTIIKDLLSLINYINIDTLHKIIKGLDIEGNTIYKLINECTENEKIEYIFNLLTLKICDSPTLDNDVFKLSSMLFKQADSSVIKQTIDELLKLSIQTLTNIEKRQWGDILYDIFQKSENIKKLIFLFVVKIGVKNQFRKDKTNTVRKFSKDEEIIIKTK